MAACVLRRPEITSERLVYTPPATTVAQNQSSRKVEKSKEIRKGNATQKSSNKVCKFWAEGRCVQGKRCQRLHSWFSGEGFTMVAKLQGHTKAVTGITIPEGSNKLVSAGKDGIVREWDGSTGQCVAYNMPGEVGCLLSEGPWIFVGLPNFVRAWNSQANAAFNLNLPEGQVHAMVVDNDTLFVGAHDGLISAWNLETRENAVLLEGHTDAVMCLTIGAKKLYSGSADQTIRVWNLDTLECNMTLTGHSGSVTSLMRWNQFLISGSLDCTIKVWACTEQGQLEAYYSRTEDDGVLALSGMADAESKPIMLCSCNDGSVRLYDMPSFAERGRLFAKEVVRTVGVGSGGVFYSGDATGHLTVWKLMDAGSKVA